MVLPLLLCVVAGCAAIAAWSGYYTVRDRAVVLRQLWAAGVVEVLVVAQMLVVGVLAGAGTVPAHPGLLWGYLVAALALLPAASLWAFAERTRWSSVVMVGAAVTVAVLEWRLWQIWNAS